MQKSDKRIILCLAHMSGNEMKYIQEAFYDNWVVPLGPNVNKFEEELQHFCLSLAPSPYGMGVAEPYPQCIMPHENDAEKLWRQSPNSIASPLPEGEGRGERPSGHAHPIVALCSGTAAVHLSLVALGIGRGDEVICQSFTFCASSHPVTYVGATPVFVDSERESWNIDPQLLEEAIKDRIAKTGKKPKAVIVVYLYGMPAKIDEIMAVCQKYDIPLIEDAAEGLGSRYKGKVCGTFGEYGILSFNGNKMITTSGGGALICLNDAARDQVMFYATQAREGYPYYQHEKIGYNYRLSNICAGIGRGQLTVLDEHIAWHKHIAARYKEAFNNIDGITFHDNPWPEADSNFWLNTIVIDPNLRVAGQEKAYTTTVRKAVGGAAGVIHFVDNAHTDCEPNSNVEALRVYLDKMNIESRPLWKPMHKQPVYRDAPRYENGVSEDLFHKGLCLPSGPWVTDKDVDYIIENIKDALL